MPSTIEQTFTRKQVAERYGVQVDAVDRWVDAGELVGVLVNRTPNPKRRRLRFSEQALAEFEAKRSTAPPSKPKRQRRRRQAGVKEYF